LQCIKDASGENNERNRREETKKEGENEEQNETKSGKRRHPENSLLSCLTAKTGKDSSSSICLSFLLKKSQPFPHNLVSCLSLMTSFDHLFLEGRHCNQLTIEAGRRARERSN
jgi:hypothetical protein